MDVKKIIMLGGGFIGSFAVLVMVMYFLYPYLNPEKAEQAKEPADMQEVRFDPSKYGPKAVESLNKQIENLQLAVDSLISREANYFAQIDSLNGRIVEVQQEKEKALAELPEKLANKSREGVSKSLLTLDEEALAPIVNLLEERQLVNLYNSASNMQKSKLLRTLKPETAAKILKEVM